MNCSESTTCDSYAPRATFLSDCTPKENVGCLGPRTFQKNRLCRWTSGYQWSTSFLLSLTLGGFGADRFYLGHIATGIAKILTFGGFGIWTVVDVILTATGFLHPVDGSLLLNT